MQHATQTKHPVISSIESRRPASALGVCRFDTSAAGISQCTAPTIIVLHVSANNQALCAMYRTDLCTLETLLRNIFLHAIEGKIQIAPMRHYLSEYLVMRAERRRNMYFVSLLSCNSGRLCSQRRTMLSSSVASAHSTAPLFCVAGRNFTTLLDATRALPVHMRYTRTRSLSVALTPPRPQHFSLQLDRRTHTVPMFYCALWPSMWLNRLGICVRVQNGTDENIWHKCRRISRLALLHCVVSATDEMWGACSILSRDCCRKLSSVQTGIVGKILTNFACMHIQNFKFFTYA